MKLFDSRHAGHAVYVHGYVYLLHHDYLRDMSSMSYFLLSNNPDFDGSACSNRLGFTYSWVQEITSNEGIWFSNSYCDQLLGSILEEFEQMNYIDYRVYLESGDIVPLNIAPALRRSIAKKRKKIINKKSFMLKGVSGDEVFSDIHSYHSHGTPDNYMQKGGDKGHEYWVGIELEVECNNEACERWIRSVNSNWFYLEKDGSLSNRGVEIITIRMNPKVASNPKTWEALVSELTELGATSHDSGRCGIHVHVSRTAFGKTDEEIDETLGKVFHLYHNELGGNGYGRDYISKVMRRRYVEYARDLTNGLEENVKSTINFLKASKLDAINPSYTKEAFKGISKNGSQSRYVAINREPSNTIEFRQGRGTLKADSIAVTVRFVCELVEFARKSSNKRCTRDNFLMKIKSLSPSTPLRKLLFN